MIADARKVGEIFRAKREEQKLSLKEVESSTSIRSSYLQAIEEGNVEKFLSMIYMYGFMRQYATFLGLDIEKLVKEHPEVFKVKGEKQEFAYGIGTLEKRNSISHGMRFVPNLLWGGGIIGVLLFAYWLAKLLGVV